MLYQDDRYNKEFVGKTSTQFTDIVPRAKGLKFLYFAEIDITDIDYDGSGDYFSAMNNDQSTSNFTNDIFGVEEVIVFHNENKIYYKHEPQKISKVFW